MNNSILLSINNDRPKLNKRDQEVQHFFHWDLIENAEIVGPHHHPKLSPVFEVPSIKRMVTLNNAPSERRPEECGLCFYTKDPVIERIRNNPTKYLGVINRFPLVFGLDYSILINMFYPQQVNNCWRNFVMTYWLQQHHPTVVPNAGYGGIETLSWSFDGLPEDSWLSVTTQGSLSDCELKWAFLNGLHELVRTKHPRGIIVYGRFPEAWKDKFPVPIRVFQPYAESKWGGNR